MPTHFPDVSRRQFLVTAGGTVAILATGGAPAWVVAAGQPGAGTPVQPQRSDTLVMTWGGQEPNTMFGPGGGGTGMLFTASKVLERLLKLDDELSFQYLLAEAVEPSPDFKQYTIRLRKGVKWHDGQPFTAGDVVYNVVEHWRKLTAGIALKTLTDASATDEHTVVLTFSQPVPAFFLRSVLADQYQFVIPKHLYDGKDIVTHPLNNTPVGTGPWKYGQWTRGSHVEFVNNPEYWQSDEPYFNKLIIRWWKDPSSRAAALEAGTIDLAYSNPVPPPEVKRLLATGKFNVDRAGYQGGSWTVTVEFNQRRDHVKDRKVRHAILHAIDREFIVDTIYFGQGKPAISPIFRTNTLFFTEDVPKYPFDPKKAAQLLDEAGLPEKKGGRFTVNLVAAAWFEENVKLGQYLKQALEDVGIVVRLETLDRASSLKRIYTDYDYDMAISNYVSPVEPIPTITKYFTTDGIMKGASFRNATGYSSPEMDKLVDSMAVETDEAKRKALIQDFARLASTDVPIVPLVEIEAVTIASKKLHNISTGAHIMGESLGDTWRES